MNLLSIIRNSIKLTSQPVRTFIPKTSRPFQLKMVEEVLYELENVEQIYLLRKWCLYRTKPS